MGLAGFEVGFAELGGFFEFLFFAGFAFGLDLEEFAAGGVEETHLAGFVGAQVSEGRG